MIVFVQVRGGWRSSAFVVVQVGSCSVRGKRTKRRRCIRPIKRIKSLDSSPYRRRSSSIPSSSELFMCTFMSNQFDPNYHHHYKLKSTVAPLLNLFHYRSALVSTIAPLLNLFPIAPLLHLINYHSALFLRSLRSYSTLSPGRFHLSLYSWHFTIIE
jgi:hypothetical protein